MLQSTGALLEEGPGYTASSVGPMATLPIRGGSGSGTPKDRETSLSSADTSAPTGQSQIKLESSQVARPRDDTQPPKSAEVSRHNFASSRMSESTGMLASNSSLSEPVHRPQQFTFCFIQAYFSQETGAYTKSEQEARGHTPQEQPIVGKKRPLTSPPLKIKSCDTPATVKDLGACWRCKFLGKKCDTQTLCSACPQKATAWSSIGCRRGPLRDVLPPVTLCSPRRSSIATAAESSEGPKSEQSSRPDDLTSANSFLNEIEQQRNSLLHTIENSTQPPEGTAESKTHWETCKSFFSSIPISSAAAKHNPKTLQKDISLRHGATWLMWEVQNNSRLREIFTNSQPLQTSNLSDVFTLLTAAVTYQIQERNYQLIQKSFLCLQACIEAFQTHNSCNLTHITHEACPTSSCQLHCFSRLDRYLKDYLDLLTMVLFKNNNLNCRDWWLSVFYSLCIQSHVRKLLMELAATGAFQDHVASTSQYMHLAVRLFSVSCGSTSKKSYDPLNMDLDNLSQNEVILMAKHQLAIEEAKSAKIAVGQSRWADSAITGSYNYLEHLFGGIHSTPAPSISRKRSDRDREIDEREMVNHAGKPHFQRSIRKSFQAKRLPTICTNLYISNSPSITADSREIPPSPNCSSLQPQPANLFQPQWIRPGEAWCGYCRPGRWIKGAEAWWNDRCLFHGVCAETGRPFAGPEIEEEIPGGEGLWRGKCRDCAAWVKYRKGDWGHYSEWFVHAADCADKRKRGEVEGVDEERRSEVEGEGDAEMEVKIEEEEQDEEEEEEEEAEVDEEEEEEDSDADYDFVNLDSDIDMEAT